MIFGFFAAWQGHTDQSRAFAQDVIAALADCGIAHKAAALDMGIHPADFSRQLAGVDPLNAYRLLALPGAFQVALLKRQAQRFGASLITAQEREFIVGVAQLGKRRMAKMLPQRAAERKQA
jgi:hypothetical protein